MNELGAVIMTVCFSLGMVGGHVQVWFMFKRSHPAETLRFIEKILTVGISVAILAVNTWLLIWRAIDVLSLCAVSFCSLLLVSYLWLNWSRLWRSPPPRG